VLWRSTVGAEVVITSLKLISCWPSGRAGGAGRGVDDHALVSQNPGAEERTRASAAAVG